MIQSYFYLSSSALLPLSQLPLAERRVGQKVGVASEMAVLSKVVHSFWYHAEPSLEKSV